MNTKSYSAVFLDRDGVLNKKAPPHDYIKSFSEFEWNAGAIELIQKIRERNLLPVVISNQRGIARGMMTLEFVEALHARMNQELNQYMTSIEAFYVCPHMEGCECRKPKPGLFFRAAEDLNIDLSQSIMIGDSVSDEEAAKNAGCKGVILISSDIVDTGYIMSRIDTLMKS
jgi:D-glycero-D-manno-heptose 1,7-bisphosphate phosphatase